jgi:hypothetical protein
MDIFISWPGAAKPRGRGGAQRILAYDRQRLQSVAFLCDIDKGARWNSDLAAALATANAGIICLTPNNLTAPYILFESGAISKTVEKSFVCTLLIGMEASDVSGPGTTLQ